MLEQPKPDHLRSFAAKPPYAWRMLIVCSVFGPPLGAVLLLIGFSLADPQPNQAARMIPFAIPFSYFFGGLPAILTGLLAVLLRLKRNWPGIAAMTAVGALLSVIAWKVLDMPFTGLAFAATSAAAALVLSIFLPKPSAYGG